MGSCDQFDWTITTGSILPHMASRRQKLNRCLLTAICILTLTRKLANLGGLLSASLIPVKFSLLYILSAERQSVPLPGGTLTMKPLSSISSRWGNKMANSKKLNIPKFSSEAEEAAWWNAHRADIEAELRSRIRNRKPVTLGQLEEGTALTRPVTVRISRDDIERMKTTAAERGVGYQTYMKMLLRGALDQPLESFFLNLDFNIEANDSLRDPQRDGYLRTYEFSAQARIRRFFKFRLDAARRDWPLYFPWAWRADE